MLGKRRNAHDASTWGPSGGHLEFGEGLEECAIREVLEETGLKIEKLEFLAIANDIFEAEGKHYISIFMKAYVKADQIVKNFEPHKVDEWHWFYLDQLPAPLFPPLKNFLSGEAYGSQIDELVIKK